MPVPHSNLNHKDLWTSTGLRAHLVGICGSGMRALACLLVDSGWRLTGSDRSASPEEIAFFSSLKIPVLQASQSQIVFESSATDHPNLLIYSAAVPLQDPDRQRALVYGIPQFSYPDFVGKLTSERTTLAVAGTHGKSTTTALLGWILRQSGNGAGLLCGGTLIGLERGGWDLGGRTLVLESCEYQSHFLEYSPNAAAILNVESDHFDCFPTVNSIHEAFCAFANKLPSNGRLIVPVDDASTINWDQVTSARIERFGLSNNADWRVRDLATTPNGSRFELFHKDSSWGIVELPLPGRHNVLNALAAVALAHSAGLNRVDCLAPIPSFPGLRRRFERIGDLDGVTLIDDYAHHPTAISATIATARQQFAGKRILGIFQPHQVSRTEGLFEQFARSLCGLDYCWISPVFAAREAVDTETRSAMSKRLTERMRQLGGNGEFLPALDPIPRTLDDSLRPGDVLLTMGAGDISRLHHAWTHRLQRNHRS